MQQFINGLSLGSSYALLGVSVALVWGVLHVLSFLQTQLMVWGAFAALVTLEWGWPVPLAVLAAIVVAAAMSGFVDVTFFAALRKRHAGEYSFVLVTIGLSLTLDSILAIRTGAQPRPFPRDGFPVEPLTIFGTNVPRLSLVMLIVAIVIMLLLGFWLRRTRSGMAVRAVAYNHEAAEILGINSRRVFATAFMVSGALAAIVGVFFAVTASQISHSSFDSLLVFAFAATILGGLGSIPGAVVGGLALGLMSVYATVYISPTFRQAVAMGSILLVLAVRPSGLFGRAATTRV